MLPTYTAGLLQAKAYRLLKQHLGKTLTQYHLTMAEWALVGQLLDHPQGLRLADIAKILSVEPPLVTNLVDGLEKRLVVERTPDPTDRRAKRIVLTPSGRDLVIEVEQIVREIMRTLLKGVAQEDLAAYLRVLEAICANATVKVERLDE